jgi:hypothetical protein
LIDVLETVLALNVGGVKRIFKKVGGKEKSATERRGQKGGVQTGGGRLATG